MKFGADPNKIEYHPVGIRIDRFPFKENSSPAEQDAQVRILTVARLTPEKDLHTGLRAIRKLLDRNPHILLEYQIIGDGPLKEELAAYARELEIDEFVRFLGPQPHEDVIDVLHKADLFFLPSKAEVLPVVLIEAQAVGLPIIATLVGAVSEVVENGRSGFLVPPGDADSMTERLEYLIMNRPVWPELGQAGREYVKRKFDMLKLNKRLVEIYKNLM
jgi:colanic acid/amylovoran biosynthesis glycosyltransferase